MTDPSDATRADGKTHTGTTPGNSAEGAYLPRDHNLHPPALSPAYRSSQKRAPQRPLIRLDQGPGDHSSPVFGHNDLGALDHDLLRNYAKEGEPIGERIILHGYLRDENARPVPHALIEIWQANAGGRYRHRNDTYLAPIDPNFGGCGRILTDELGYYRFHTVKPGAYPWPNGGNTWRPAHVHFSVFGHAFCQRLITQLYFEGDPLIPLCPIVQAIPDAQAIDRLTARLDMSATQPFDSIAYRFDIVLRGRDAVPFENKPEGL